MRINPIIYFYKSHRHRGGMYRMSYIFFVLSLLVYLGDAYAVRPEDGASSSDGKKKAVPRVNAQKQEHADRLSAMSPEDCAARHARKNATAAAEETEEAPKQTKMSPHTHLALEGALGKYFETKSMAHVWYQLQEAGDPAHKKLFDALIGIEIEGERNPAFLARFKDLAKKKQPKYWAAFTEDFLVPLRTEAILLLSGNKNVAPNKVTKISLMNKEIQRLYAGVFDAFLAVESINFDLNKLAALPSGLFDYNTALTKVRSNNNQLDRLPAGLFDRNMALTTVHLGMNHLKVVPADLFHHNPALTEVNLDHNRLTVLPPGLFHRNTALTKVIWHSNRLTVLPAGLFHHNTVLTEVNLRHNHLAELSAGLFDRNTALTIIYLNDKKLTAFPILHAAVLRALTFLSLTTKPLLETGEAPMWGRRQLRAYLGDRALWIIPIPRHLCSLVPQKQRFMTCLKRGLGILILNTFKRPRCQRFLERRCHLTRCP